MGKRSCFIGRFIMSCSLVLIRKRSRGCGGVVIGLSAKAHFGVVKPHQNVCDYLAKSCQMLDRSGFGAALCCLIRGKVGRG